MAPNARETRLHAGVGDGAVPRTARSGVTDFREVTLITTEDIRRWAIALPEVEETSHFRFRVPQFKVRGRTFAGLGKDATTAVFCVSEQEAVSATADDPATCQAVRRRDARRRAFGESMSGRPLASWSTPQIGSSVLVARWGARASPLASCQRATKAKRRRCV